MPSSDPEQVVTNPQPQARAAQEVLRYWSPQRVESAKPLPLPKVYLPRRLREQLDEVRRRSAGRGGSAAPTISEPVPADHPAEPAPTAAGFDTHLVGNISVYPYAIVGKLFMTFDGANYVGSAWTVGESAVFTAGHCVHGLAEGWADNIMFQSGYNNGASTGSWGLPRLASLAGWTQDEDFEYDMAVGIASTPIRPVTGKAGWIANIGDIQGNIKSVGYPAEVIPNYNFNGERMWECVGSYLGRGSSPDEDDIMAMQNNMTGGCSGGPGFTSRGGSEYAMWVNSFRYTSEPKKLRSPYFAAGFLNLIQWMRDNGGDV